jgi:hypothetical protein
MPGAKVSRAIMTGGGTTVFCGDVESTNGRFYTPKGFISIIQRNIGNKCSMDSVVFPLENDNRTVMADGRTTYIEQHSDSSVDAALDMDWSELPPEQQQWVKNALLAVRAVGEEIDTLTLSDFLAHPNPVRRLATRMLVRDKFAELTARYTRYATTAGLETGDTVESNREDV